MPHQQLERVQQSLFGLSAPDELELIEIEGEPLSEAIITFGSAVGTLNIAARAEGSVVENPATHPEPPAPG